MKRLRAPEPTLDANALELFARVVQAGSFAQAARKLGQTRAAVSRRIAAIEAQIGQPLLARTTRSLGLTEAGRRLAARARAVLDAAEAARGALRATQAGLAGRLRITAAPSFGRAVLLPLLAEFRRLHPGVQYELLFTDRRVDLLREGVDVAFRITRKPPEDWVALALMPFRVGAYASPEVFAPLDGPAQLADLALAGTGAVLAPHYCVSEALAQGRLLDLLPGWHLPIPEGDTVQALTLPLPVTGESARALVRFVADRLNKAG